MQCAHLSDLHVRTLIRKARTGICKSAARLERQLIRPWEDAVVTRLLRQEFPSVRVFITTRSAACQGIYHN